MISHNLTRIDSEIVKFSEIRNIIYKWLCETCAALRYSRVEIHPNVYFSLYGSCGEK